MSDTTRTRIAHVTSSLFDPLGGAEQYCIELALWQAAQGHEVEIFGAGASDALRGRLAAEGLRVQDLERPRPYRPGVRGSRFTKVAFHGADLLDSLMIAPSTRRVLAGRHDVVHVHRWQGLGTAPLRLPDTATVHTVHDFALVDTAATSIRDGELPREMPLPQQLRARLLLRTADDLDAAIFPTRRTRDRHVQLGFDVGERAHVVPHGWRLPVRERPTDMARPSAQLTVTFMGKLIADKGVGTLLEAWSDPIPGTRLVLAGAGDQEPDIAARAAVGDDVEFRGWLDKDAQADLLAETDVLVLPSHWPENFPLVVAEALLAGVPVLATTISAPEILQDGTNAVIVPPSASELRGAVQRLARDGSRLAGLRAGALSSAEALDMSRHGAAVQRIYEQALARRPDRRAGSRR